GRNYPNAVILILVFLQHLRQPLPVGMRIWTRDGLLRNTAAKPDPVDDAGVVELVAVDNVLVAGLSQVARKQGRKERLVCGKGRRMQYCGFTSHKPGDSPLQLEVYGLSAAQKADRRQSIAPFVQPCPGSLFDLRMVCKAEIVVGRQHYDLAAPDLDLPGLL